MRKIPGFEVSLPHSQAYRLQKYFHHFNTSADKAGEKIKTEF